MLRDDERDEFRAPPSDPSRAAQIAALGEVLALARSGRRAVVTNNVRDFRPLHVEAVMPGGTGHYGMISMAGNYRRTKSDIGRIVAALEAKLTQYPGEEDLANAEEWL